MSRLVVLLSGVVLGLARKWEVVGGQRHLWVRLALQFQLAMLGMLIYGSLVQRNRNEKERERSRRQSTPSWLGLSLPVVTFTMSFVLDTMSLSFLNIHSHTLLSVLSLVMVVCLTNAMAHYQHQRLPMSASRCLALLLVLGALLGQGHEDTLNQRQEHRLQGLLYKLTAETLLAGSYVYEDRLLRRGPPLELVVYWQGLLGTLLVLIWQLGLVLHFSPPVYLHHLAVAFLDSWPMLWLCVVSLLLYGHYYYCQLWVTRHHSLLYRMWLLKVKASGTHLLADWLFSRTPPLGEVLAYGLEVLGYWMVMQDWDLYNKPGGTLTLNLNTNLIRLHSQLRSMGRLVWGRDPPRQGPPQKYYHDNDTTIEELYLSLHHQ